MKLKERGSQGERRSDSAPQIYAIQRTRRVVRHSLT